MKILSATQLKAMDAYTIEHEPITSINLMERASRAVADKICSRWAVDTPVKIFAGPGNICSIRQMVFRPIVKSTSSV